MIDLRHQVIDSETGWVVSLENDQDTAQRVIDARTRTGAATHMRPLIDLTEPKVVTS
jgi:hypothetical protein